MSITEGEGNRDKKHLMFGPKPVIIKREFFLCGILCEEKLISGSYPDFFGDIVFYIKFRIEHPQVIITYQ